MLRFGVDPEDYVAHVFGTDLSDLLRPDTRLRDLLARLPQRKVVFTNAPRVHAEHVLDLLALGPLLDDVIALEDLGLVPKPDPSAYGTALARVGVAAGDCCFVDDTHGNVLAAARVGMRAVWVAHGREPARPDATEPHERIESLLEIEALLSASRR
jgi:putative hydrolase of the HAD superfamily